MSEFGREVVWNSELFITVESDVRGHTTFSSLDIMWIVIKFYLIFLFK